MIIIIQECSRTRTQRWSPGAPLPCLPFWPLLSHPWVLHILTVVEEFQEDCIHAWVLSGPLLISSQYLISLQSLLPKCDWWEVPIAVKGGWKWNGMESGALCVTTAGTWKTWKWCAGSWAVEQPRGYPVVICISHWQMKNKKSSSKTSTAMGRKMSWLNVTSWKTFLIAPTARMQGQYVRVSMAGLTDYMPTAHTPHDHSLSSLSLFSTMN